MALLDGEREGAGDDEDRDERGEQGEHGQPGDGVLSAESVVGRFRLAALRAGQHPQTGRYRVLDRTQIGDGLRVGAGLEDDADQVGPATAAGRARLRRRRGRRPAPPATRLPRRRRWAIPATLEGGSSIGRHDLHAVADLDRSTARESTVENGFRAGARERARSSARRGSVPRSPSRGRPGELRRLRSAVDRRRSITWIATERSAMAARDARHCPQPVRPASPRAGAARGERH